MDTAKKQIEDTLALEGELAKARRHCETLIDQRKVWVQALLGKRCV